MMQIIARTQGSHLFDELAAGTKTASETHFANVDKFNKAESAISPDLLAEKNPDVVETKPIIDGTTWNDFLIPTSTSVLPTQPVEIWESPCILLPAMQPPNRCS